MIDKEVLKEALMDSAVITDEELPSHANNRMTRLIQRVKDEYHFSMIQPDFDVTSEFDLVNDPFGAARRLIDSLLTATIKNDECILNGAVLDIYEGSETQPFLLRTAYFDIFELVLNGLQIPLRNYHNLVLGSPGIGKSFFHPFCLYVLIRANAPVFFQKDDYSGLFYEGKLYKCKVPLAESTLLSGSNTWVLYDRKEPPNTISRKNVSIMVSSPKKERYWEYLKNSGCPGPFYMPLWSFAELKHINPSLPADLFVATDEELKKRYEFCGGVPRYIFVNFSSYKDNYPQALDSVKVHHLFIKEMMDIDDVSHRIFALQVPENYYVCQLDFLSRKISFEVKEHFKPQKGAILARMVKEYYDGAISAVNESIYADYGWEEFVPNVQFSMQSLGMDKTIGTLNITDLAFGDIYGHTLDEVLWEPELPAKLWIPCSRTFPCINGLLLFHSSRKALGLHYTVSLHHPVPRDALAKLINHCGTKYGCEFCLVYVVPKENFELFKQQGQTIEGKLCKPSEQVQCRQFKLELL